MELYHCSPIYIYLHLSPLHSWQYLKRVIVTLYCSVLILVSASYLLQYEALHREHFLAAGCPHATQLGGPAIKASNVSRSYVLLKLEMETSSPMA